MTREKIRPLSNDNFGNGDQTWLNTDGIKKGHSPYEAPSVKEFLLVLAVIGLLTLFSWVAYFYSEWFQ
jgi:hypothetical protein